MPRNTYPLNCAGQTAFVDPAFDCPPGYEEVQRPPDPPASCFVPQNPGNVSVDYYWKSVISLPTACNNISKVMSTQSVEFTTGIEAQLEGKLGGLKLTGAVKTGQTLGFELPFGEVNYIYQATLYQLHAYIKFSSFVTPGALGEFEFLLAILAWKLGLNFSPSDCSEQDVPLSTFELHTCRKFCGPKKERKPKPKVEPKLERVPAQAKVSKQDRAPEQKKRGLR